MIITQVPKNTDFTMNCLVRALFSRDIIRQANRFQFNRLGTRLWVLTLIKGIKGNGDVGEYRFNMSGKDAKDDYRNCMQKTVSNLRYILKCRP
jgi:hypothetical protein